LLLLSKARGCIPCSRLTEASARNVPQRRTSPAVRGAPQAQHPLVPQPTPPARAGIGPGASAECRGRRLRAARWRRTSSPVEEGTRWKRWRVSDRGRQERGRAGARGVGDVGTRRTATIARLDRRSSPTRPARHPVDRRRVLPWPSLGPCPRLRVRVVVRDELSLRLRLQKPRGA